MFISTAPPRIVSVHGAPAFNFALDLDIDRARFLYQQLFGFGSGTMSNRGGSDRNLNNAWQAVLPKQAGEGFQSAGNEPGFVLEDGYGDGFAGLGSVVTGSNNFSARNHHQQHVSLQPPRGDVPSSHPFAGRAVPENDSNFWATSSPTGSSSIMNSLPALFSGNPRWNHFQPLPYQYQNMADCMPDGFPVVPDTNMSYLTAMTGPVDFPPAPAPGTVYGSLSSTGASEIMDSMARTADDSGPGSSSPWAPVARHPVNFNLISDPWHLGAPLSHPHHLPPQPEAPGTPEQQQQHQHQQHHHRELTISPKALRINPTPTPPLSRGSSSQSELYATLLSAADTDGPAFDPEPNPEPEPAAPKQHRRPRKQLPDRPAPPVHLQPAPQPNPPSSHSRRHRARRSSSPSSSAAGPSSRAPKRSKRVLAAAPAPASEGVGEEEEEAVTAAEERRSKDAFLVANKRAGYTYKEIRQRGGFTEAESTLRGRYRTLTKSREARVRKPEWEAKDDRLLRKAVRKLAKGEALATAKIPWKAVGEYIVDNGGSYHFGNTTCRKRWDRLVEEGQEGGPR